MEPVPAIVPVNLTEQLPAESRQVLALSEPPVVPAVNVKVTVPVGVLVDVVVSVTVAATEVVQLLAPSAMLQLTFPTLMKVLSLLVEVTVTVAEAVVPVL